LKFVIEVTGKEAYVFNKELEPVQDILVLHVENGRDHFISVEGTFRKSIFGIPLAEIELINGLPAPLKYLLDVMLIYTPSKFLFFELGDPMLCDKIIEMLDKKEKLAFDLSYSPDCVAITVAQVILMFFDALPDPLLPSERYEQFIKASYDRNMCTELISNLPALNKFIFEIFVLDYLKKHCEACGLEGRNLSYLCRIVGSVLIKPKDSAKLGKEEELRDLRHKARFIKQFLVANPNNSVQK
jgi:inositol polyphosphate 5-phosphatase INPP5B/F